MGNRKQIDRLGQILKQARTEKGLSARELSDQIGVHHTTISMLERAQIEQPRPDKLSKLATALGLDSTDLLTLAGYHPSDKLPAFGVYLRTTTTLPDQAIDELHGYYQYLYDKYGVEASGPIPGEDEEESKG